MIVELGKYKDVDKNSCNWKGWLWEMRVGDAVRNVQSVGYEGNSSDFYEWLHMHNKNAC